MNRRSLLSLSTAFLASGYAPAPSEILVETDDGAWPDLNPWLERVQGAVPGWWRRINAAIAEDHSPPRRRVRLQLCVIRPDGIGAVTQGDSIMINAPYVRANGADDDMSHMIAHELAHVVQAYPPHAGPGWLIEGIADFARYYVLFPRDPGRTFDPGRDSWADGYAPAAGFLDWIETHRPRTIATLNGAMRQGRDGEAQWLQTLGKPASTLWQAYLESRPHAANAQRRRRYLESLKPSPAATP